MWTLLPTNQQSFWSSCTSLRCFKAASSDWDAVSLWQQLHTVSLHVVSVSLLRQSQDCLQQEHLPGCPVALGHKPAEQVQESLGRHQHNITVWQREVQEGPVSKRSSLSGLTNLQPMIRHAPGIDKETERRELKSCDLSLYTAVWIYWRMHVFFNGYIMYVTLFVNKKGMFSVKFFFFVRFSLSLSLWSIFIVIKKKEEAFI